MTPAINELNKHGIDHRVHEYAHDPSSQSYGLEAASKLGVDESRVFKTLVVELGTGELAVAIIPVVNKLSMKLLAKAAGAKKAAMADKKDVERSTGYVLGGVSPLGQRKRLRTVLDESAEAFDTIYVSAGRRGLEIELDPAALLRLTGGSSARVCE